MANYYDWIPPEDEPQAETPQDTHIPQPESLPTEPPVESGVPVELLNGAIDTNHNALAASDITPSEEDAFAEPIDSEDELHPMYRVVAALMETEAVENTTNELTDSQVAPVLDATAPESVAELESASPTETLADALRTDVEPLPFPSRIEDLTQAIEHYPHSPVNYVLRGEAHWEEGHGVEAVKDFLMALRLAESRDTTWEYLNRSFLDRARQGLRRSGYQNK